MVKAKEYDESKDICCKQQCFPSHVRIPNLQPSPAIMLTELSGQTCKNSQKGEWR